MIISTRNSFKHSHKKLKRARWLYALFIRRDVEGDETGILLEVAAKRACEAGLFAKSACQTSDYRMARYCFLRKFQKLHHPRYHDRFGWSHYLNEHNWECGPFTRKQKVEAAA